MNAAMELVFFVFMFFLAFISMFFVLYNLARTLREIKKDMVSDIFAPFSLLMSSVYTERGNYHRKNMLVWLIIFIVSITTVTIIMDQ